MDARTNSIHRTLHDTEVFPHMYLLFKKVIWFSKRDLPRTAAEPKSGQKDGIGSKSTCCANGRS